MRADSEVTELIRSGDKNTFELVFKSNYGSLCSYAMKFVKDNDIAEEIVQEFFCQYWLKREEMLITGSLKQYLFRAVHNSCLNHIKHLSIRDKYSEHTLWENKQNIADETDKIELSELHDKIRDSIGQLPTERQKIFIMNRYEGLKYKEIAEKLDISIKTVENQMGKALKFLRDALKDYIPIMLLVVGKIIYNIFKN